MADKKRRKKFAAAAAAAVLVFALLIIWAAVDGDLQEYAGTLGSHGGNAHSEPGLNIYFADVGQGDCILVTCGGKSMLVDAGERAYEQDVAIFLSSKGIKKLDYVVATHPHSDHIGSLPFVIDKFGADNIVLPRIPYELTPASGVYSDLLDRAASLNVIAARSGERFSLGDARITVVGPVKDSAENLNNMSAVLRVDYGGTSALLTADAEFEEELDILESGQNIDCDLLKLGHHGSAGSTGERFLEAVTPGICVISVGADNDYGHPAAGTLGRVSEYTSEIYRTDRCGTITAHSDGEKFEITY